MLLLELGVSYLVEPHSPNVTANTNNRPSTKDNTPIKMKITCLEKDKETANNNEFNFTTQTVCVDNGSSVPGFPSS